jgi:hypothetical protein
MYRAARALHLGRSLATVRRRTVVPTVFADGDHITQAGVAWVRQGGQWVIPDQPDSLVADDQAMRLGWGPETVCHRGYPAYTPAGTP